MSETHQHLPASPGSDTPRTAPKPRAVAWPPSRSVSHPREIVLAGVFTALTVLLTYVFALQTPFVRFSFGFLPLAIYAAWAGPWHAACVAAAADLAGVALFGAGMFFPGFTLSAIVVGLIYGFSFHHRNVTWRRAALAFLFVDLSIHLLLNTFWLYLLYHKGVFVLLASRLPKILLCCPLHIGLFLMVYRPLSRWLARRDS